MAFLCLLSFVTSFVAARVFATLNPTMVVESQGIHFHHFWYGLAMITIAGWLGIAHNNRRYVRLYSVIFGLGGGLVGDEIGLLLTFGNYNSSLTFFFAVIVVALGSMGILTFRYKKQIEYDVIYLEGGERAIYFGLVVAGLSALAFATDRLPVGALILLLGVLVGGAGQYWRRRRTER